MTRFQDGAAEALAALPFRVETLPVGDHLYPPGAGGLPCFILLEGSVIRYKLRHDASRAIVAFELPGDIVNLEALLLSRTDCGATATAPSTVAVIDAEVMSRAWRSSPALELALWRYAFVKAATLEEWLLNIGKRSPVARIAHVLFEIHTRLAAIVAPSPDATTVNVSPQEIADAMGLQPVVVTRHLQNSVFRGVITVTEAAIVIDDPARLAKIGEFQPNYLHMAT